MLSLNAQAASYIHCKDVLLIDSIAKLFLNGHLRKGINLPEALVIWLALMVTSTYHFGTATQILDHVLRFCTCISAGEHTKHQNLNPYLNTRAKEIAICYGALIVEQNFNPLWLNLVENKIFNTEQEKYPNRPVKFISSLCTAEKKWPNRYVAQQFRCSTLQLNRSKKMLSLSHKTFLLFLQWLFH